MQSVSVHTNVTLFFQAVDIIHTIRASSDTLKEQEAVIRRGLNIFKIDQAPNKDVVQLDSDLENLETIWSINRYFGVVSSLLL